MNKNYDISACNEITKQVRMSYELRAPQQLTAVNDNSTLREQKTEQALGLMANADAVTISRRSNDYEEVLAHKRMLIDASELFMHKPNVPSDSDLRSHSQLVSDRYMDRVVASDKHIHGNYYDYLNRQSMRQSVNASFTSSQTDMHAKGKDMHPQITDSNSLLEYKKPKKKLVKAQRPEEDTNGEKSDNHDGQKRDVSKEKMMHALAAIQDKLDALAAAQQQSRSEIEDRSENRNFVILNKGDNRPKQFEVEHSYMGYYSNTQQSKSPSPIDAHKHAAVYPQRGKTDEVRSQADSRTKPSMSPIAHSDMNKFRTRDKSPVLTAVPNVFSFNKFATQELEVFHSQLNSAEITSLQNFGVLLNFFVSRRLKQKYADVVSILRKVVRRSENIARVRDRLDVLYRKKMIRDFCSASVFQRKKLNTGCELVQTLVKNNKRKLLATIKLLRERRGSSVKLPSGDFMNISEINRQPSTSKTNRLFSRINLASNNLDISDIKDCSIDDSFEQMENEYESKVQERQRRTTTFYSNIMNL